MTNSATLYYDNRTYQIVCSCLDQAAALPDLSEIIIYGSRVGGNVRKDSDLDVACFFSLPPAGILDQYRTLMRICNISEADIQIQAFCTAELEEPCGIVEEIVRDGVAYHGGIGVHPFSSRKGNTHYERFRNSSDGSQHKEQCTG